VGWEEQWWSGRWDVGRWEEGKVGGGRWGTVVLWYLLVITLFSLHTHSPFHQAMERAVKVLDHIPPYDTHKIGVVYVGQGQVG